MTRGAEVERRGDRTAAAERHHVRRRSPVLVLGLPRDPAGPRHVAGFLAVTVLTVLVTRGALALTGFPQLGGGGLHIAHVLWGGLLMAVAVVGVLSWAGPVVRPLAALVGGIGFGLFIDEIGKFVTSDNDYFYEPTASLIYVVVVVLVLVGEAIHGRRRDPHETLAAAADLAVAGLAGGFSSRARRQARELVDGAGDVRGAAEVRALLDVVEDDARELPDPISAVSRAVVTASRRVARVRWLPRLTVGLLAVVTVYTVVRATVLVATGADLPWWAMVGLLASGAASLVCSLVGLRLVGRDRRRGYEWFRRAVLVNLLLSQIFLFRIDQWSAVTGLVVDLVLLGVVAAELDVLRGRSGADDLARDAAEDTAPAR
ncbi:hypothetical protein [Cellulomonas pakistanensis]|uniref:Uncharacterized protein n=1 Tax=Cellulomonas pakistanensis TaxID=992287 RepID=A0A919PA60_9CELL|nr:hypothetical protein [Cellulomonas pakistanensis]GIG34897.1 hypothetical protein Cpa01nite_02780 [Cellulomonas pakistanensis]